MTGVAMTRLFRNGRHRTLVRIRNAVLLSLLICAPALAVPRPISEAEKAACEAVADHLARGPVAIAERSGMSADEVEARIGPNADARWELRTSAGSFSDHGAIFHVVFPSGVDDVIAFEMNGKRITKIITLADQRGSVIAIIGVIVISRKRRVWPMFAILAALGLALLGWALYPRSHQPAAQPVSSSATAPQSSPYKELVAMRRAVATSDSIPQIGNLTGEAREIALMWKAQRDIGRLTPDEIEKQLYSIESSAPLKSLISARIAAASGRDPVALTNLDVVREAEPQNDAFWWEEEMAHPRETSLQPLRRMLQMGSRDADAYYLLSVEHFLDDRRPEAVSVFHEAYSLRPASRATIVSSGILSLLPRDMSSSALIDIAAPDEPKGVDGSMSQNAMTVPAGTKSTAAGSFVRLAIGNARLDIAYGAAIAPKDTEVLTGEEMDRREADDAVQRAASLTESALASGAVQHTIEDAVEALESHNRWGDIIRLTDGIGPNTESAAPELLIARVNAFVHTKQFAQARQLATSAAAQHAAERRRSVRTIATLAELLAQAGAYDDALDMYRKAKQVRGAPDMEARITQVALRRTLNMSSLTAHTAHFEIHSMPEVPPAIPGKIGAKLESDLQMLTTRFRPRNFHTVRVNVLRWDDFRWSVTGSDYVVGFYDGDLTIPWGTLLFGLSSDTVTTHELTHAVVAQASNDNAPRWFQEGVAQRMENSEKREKIQSPVALALLDATLRGSADIRDITSAYAESLRVIEFMEAKYGPQSINKMIDLYRGGASNEEAFLAVTKKSIADVDREFRAWK
jgi:hypothetical protein